MARAVLDRLPDLSVQPSVQPPSFTSLVSEQLGAVAPESDGFDGDLETALSAIDSESAALDELDGHLAEMAFTEGEFDAATLSPITADFGTAVTAGESLAADAEGALGTQPVQNPQPPTPPQPPAPPQPPTQSGNPEPGQGEPPICIGEDQFEPVPCDSPFKGIK